SQPSDQTQKAPEKHENRIVPGNRGRHSFERVLAAARSKDPSERDRGQAANGVNRAAASGVDNAVTHGGIDPELCQPATAPHPMRKKWIGPSSEKSRGSTSGGQSPALQAGAKRNQRGQSNTEDLPPRGKRNGWDVEFGPTKEKSPAPEPIPLPSRSCERVRRSSDISLPGKTTDDV